MYKQYSLIHDHTTHEHILDANVLSETAKHSATEHLHLAVKPLTPEPLITKSLSTKHCIAEVIVPSAINSAPIVLPIIASLTRQTKERWITWVTHRFPTKQMLLNSGADLSKLRIVRTSAESDNRWIVWQALAQGNSHTVVAEQNTLYKADIDQLEQAGLQGSSQGVLITHHG